MRLVKMPPTQAPYVSYPTHLLFANIKTKISTICYILQKKKTFKTYKKMLFRTLFVNIFKRKMFQPSIMKIIRIFLKNSIKLKKKYIAIFTFILICMNIDKVFFFTNFEFKAVGEIIGLICGIVFAVLLIIAIVILLCCIQRKRKQKREKSKILFN